jgi:hypothetical protein
MSFITCPCCTNQILDEAENCPNCGSPIIKYESRFPFGSIIDGVVDPCKYFKSPIRIAWFLKEAYSDETEGLHIKDYLAQENAYGKFFRTAKTTWPPIIYASYAVINGYDEFDHVPWIRDKNELCDIVKEIAIINVNKMPSETGTHTLWSNLERAFPRFRELISEQIKTLDPQIYIFGHTFYLYKEMLNIKNDHKLPESANNHRCDLYLKDNKLFIDTYHPAQTKLTWEKYCNQIITAAQQWRNMQAAA